MKLPMPMHEYDQVIEINRNNSLEMADLQNHKKRQDIEVDNAIHDDSVPGAWKISCTECDELHPMDFFGDGADELVCIKCIDTRNLAQTFQEKKAKETEMVYKSAVKNETTKEENE